MSDRMALKAAIDLLHVPAQVRLLRKQPLPDGVVTLLRIAAGDEGAENAAADLTARSQHFIRQAAIFFIEQILFAPNSDSYRVLGASSAASAGELRRNAVLLLRWLHPDLDPRDERSIFVGRVTAAWNNLKTPERRAAYDEQVKQDMLRSRSHNGRSRHTRGNSGRRHQSPIIQYAHLPRGAEKIGFFRRALAALFHRPPQ